MSTSEPTLLEEIAGDVAGRVCQLVADLPDRTSPDDQPEMMLVTGDELHDIVCQAVEDSAHIVKCVNAHDELVNALRTVQAQIQPGAHPADITGALITIRAALAKVQS